MRTRRFGLAISLAAVVACGGSETNPAASGAATGSAGHAGSGDGGSASGGSGTGGGSGGGGAGGGGAGGGTYARHTVDGTCDVVWEIGGEHDGQYMGSLAAVDDINGDGKRDLVIASSAADGGTLVELRSGADGSKLASASLTGGGWITSLGGDLDGDGIGDVGLFVSELTGGGAGGGVATNPTVKRSLAVLSARTLSVLLTLEGAEGDEGFASAAAAIADVDGDGHPDLAIGSLSDVAKGTLVDVSSATKQTIRTHSAPSTASSWFGAAVASPVDLDGDGVADRLVGDPSAAGFLGQLYALSGVDDAPIWTVTGDGASPDVLGNPFVTAGDLDGDATIDVVLGVHDHLPNGELIAVSGRTGQTLWVEQGERIEEHFGVAVVGTGDVDGDGIADLVVGAPSPMVSPILGQPGRFAILSGKDGATIASVEEIVSLNEVSYQLGSAVAGLGDVTGDGAPEVAVAASNAPFEGHSMAGRVTAYSCHR